ncbi:hypothetical protein GWK47_054217 [Chionoecetes opilio]|uniref:Uncharacterized protein n=1 Tax=Chionoecetes opilio TaxID=41210 RepID=A0A8J4Y022_CHIOP|nr:hypothetical protein GWK47_054217 [Chionoecetes opilio]
MGGWRSLLWRERRMQKVLRAAGELLDRASQAKQAVTAIDAADHSIMDVEEWLQHSREDIPNSITLRNSFQLLDVTREALNVFKEEGTFVNDEASPGHLGCTIMEAAFDVETVPVQASFDDLDSDKLNNRLDDGQVFVMQKHDDGSCYSSKVMREGKELQLHAMRKGGHLREGPSSFR